MTPKNMLLFLIARTIVFLSTCCQTCQAFNTSSLPSSLPSGANAYCEQLKNNVTSSSGTTSQARIRKDWDLISSTEKELYLQAVEEAIDRGLYQAFLKYHVDSTSSIQSHESCFFALWHRRYLLAFENMLRSLDPARFACLTVPYWNIMEHQYDQSRDLCDSFGACARIVSDLGGRPADAEETRVYATIEADGALFSGRPIQNLRDDNGEPGVVRFDLLWMEIPPTCAYSSVINILTTSSTYAEYTRRIQTGIHDDVHDNIGGFMPTYSSPMDPLFLPWHSFIDLLLYMWEACRVDSTSSGNADMSWVLDPTSSCTYTEAAGLLFPETNTTSEFHMKSNGEDIRNDPLIGKYFDHLGLTMKDVAYTRNLGEDEFTYDQLTSRIWDVLRDPIQCPAIVQQGDGGWFTAFPTASPSSGPPVAPIAPGLQEKWIDEVRNELVARYPNDPNRVGSLMAFLICTLGDDQAVPDDDFREAFIRGDASDPKCNFFLPSPENSGTVGAQDLATLAPAPSAPAADDKTQITSGDASMRNGEFDAKEWIILQMALMAVILL